MVDPKSGVSVIPGLAVAYAINNGGTIVGEGGSQPIGEPAAFISDGQKATDLNILIAAGAGYTLIKATDISDAGQIVGIAFDQSIPDRKSFVYELTPTATPEPSTLALLAAASAFAAARKLGGVISPSRRV